MTGHLPSTSNKHRWDYGPPLQAIVIVFVALFILFLWLDFIQTQQIESTGRDIQVKTEELGVLERQRDALLREISAAGSQQRMSDQAWALGYRPQTPIYLPVAQPLVQATGEAASNSWPLATPESAEGAMAETSSSLWDLLTQQFPNVELEAVP